MREDAVAREITRLRKVRNLSQSELAEMLNVTHQAVSKWERGESLPDVTLLVPLATVLGVSVDALLKGGENGEAADAGTAAATSSGLWQRARALLAAETKEVREPAPETGPDQTPSEAAAASRVRRGGPTREDVLALAPFVPAAVLARMVEAVITQLDWDTLGELAPFMSPDSLGSMLARLGSDAPDEVIVELAPFLPASALTELVKSRSDGALDWNMLVELAPFLPGDAVSELVHTTPRDQWDWETVRELAPFLPEDALMDLLAGYDPLLQEE